MVWGIGNALGTERKRKMKYMNLARFAPSIYGTNHRMNLQLFAEGEEGGADDGNASGADETGDEEGGSKDSDFDAFLKDSKNQAEFDRRLAKALETQKAKLDAAHKSEIANTRSEAEKLAKMNAEQKEQYEIEKLRKENEELKAAQAKAELSKTASQLLKDNQIDATTDILDFVVGSDAETTQANIDKFVGIIQAEIKKAEVARATGTTPKNYEGKGKELDEMEKRIAKYKR